MLNLVIVLLVPALLASAWHAVLWKGAAGIRSVRDRRGARAVVTLFALVIWLGGAWLLGSFDLTDRGTWTCRVCGKSEERLELLGLPVVRQATAGDGFFTASYHAWFERAIALQHHHDWRATGCHQIGSGTTACSFSLRPSLFYQSLPRVPDELARALVTRLAITPVEHREALLDDFVVDREPTNPFFRLARAEVLSRQEFEQSYTDWLARHPLWR